MHGGGGVSLSERRQEVALAPSDPQTFLMQLTQKTRNAQTRTGHFDWQGGGANPVSPLSTSKWVFCLDICRLYPWLVPTEAPWDCDPKKTPQSPSVPGVSPIFQLVCNNSVPLCVSPAKLVYVPAHTGVSPVRLGRKDLGIELRTFFPWVYDLDCVETTNERQENDYDAKVGSCNEVKLLNSGIIMGHLFCYQKYKNITHKYPKVEPSKQNQIPSWCVFFVFVL